VAAALAAHAESVAGETLAVSVSGSIDPEGHRRDAQLEGSRVSVSVRRG
jgi:hypothetical protein